MLETLNASVENNIDIKDINYLITKIIKVERNLQHIVPLFNLNDINKLNRDSSICIIRTGGIGDLISLSSLIYFLHKELEIPIDILKFVTQEKHKAIFDYYKVPITVKYFFEPLYEFIENIELRHFFTNLYPIHFENVIENIKYCHINWYNLQFNHIGIKKFDKEWGRPQLKTERINNNPSNIDSSKRSILINPKASAVVRSMRFEDIYIPLVKVIKDLDCNIYVHEINLNNADINFLQSVNDERIKIIEENSLEEFLLDAFDVDLSISVDSSLIHFREGIERPCIGIYGAFLYESRTKYYKYTMSFNIESDCPYMPCHKHVLKEFGICEFQDKMHKEGSYKIKYLNFAPCTCNAWNNTVQDQVYKNIENYVKLHLNM